MDKITKNNLQFRIDDVVKGTKVYLTKKHPIRSRIRMIYAIIFLLLTILNVLNLALTKKFDVWLAICALGCFYYFYSHFTYIKRNWKKEQKTKPVYNYEITSEGFSEQNENKVSNYKWESFKEAIIEKNYLIVIESRYLPRIFSQSNYSEEEFETIKNWVRNKVKVLS